MAMRVDESGKKKRARQVDEFALNRTPLVRVDIFYPAPLDNQLPIFYRRLAGHLK
jgi:hypothetical protein